MIYDGDADDRPSDHKAAAAGSAAQREEQPVLSTVDSLSI